MGKKTDTQVKGKADVVKAKAAEVADMMPDQVKDAADKVTTEARKRPVLLIVGVAIVLALIARRLMKRAKTK